MTAISRRNTTDFVVLAASTFLIAPALALGIALIIFTLATGAAAPATEWARLRRDALPLVEILAAMIAAAGGLLSLWLVIGLGPVWVCHRMVRRGTVVLGLLAGIASSVYFWLLGSSEGLHINLSKTGPGPLLVLLIPVPLSFLAAKYLLVLCRGEKRA